MLDHVAQGQVEERMLRELEKGEALWASISLLEDCLVSAT